MSCPFEARNMYNKLRGKMAENEKLIVSGSV